MVNDQFFEMTNEPSNKSPEPTATQFFIRRWRFSWLIGQNASSGRFRLKTQQRGSTLLSPSE